MFRVLVIDDDQDISTIITMYLRKEGYRVFCVTEGRQVIKALHDHNPHLIILDIMLPDTDGYTICADIRQFTDIPILFLSSKKEDTDKVKGLNIGADDYMTKPFSPRELVARVGAHLRRHTGYSLQSRDRALLSYPGLVIDQESCVVTANGETVDLSRKEYQLLILLAGNPNRVYSVNELYQTVWHNESFGDTRTVMVHLSNLRKKIERDPSEPEFIKTIRGVGYKFTPSAERVL